MNQIIRYAKIYIAKNEIKRLKDYLFNETNDINKINNIIQDVQKKSFNLVWFVNRFITQNKHIQDIDKLLQITALYSKLNKQLKTFDFNKQNNSFEDLYDFMSKFLKNKQNKDTNFNAPTYCKLILSENGYNFYYADAKDKKCFQDLHNVNKKSDGSQYAMWCVITGTAAWGDYTDDQFPFYVYVTDSNNTPVMLFNFGYNNKAQIKNIHNNAFVNYSQNLIQSIEKNS